MLESVRKQEEAKRGLLLMGHPGIGKTLLLDMLLSWSLKTEPEVPVLVLAEDGAQVFLKHSADNAQKRFRFAIATASEVILNFLKAQSTLVTPGIGDVKHQQILVLHDIKIEHKYNGGLVTRLADEMKATIVVASSPNQANYKDFENFMHPVTRFVLPTLSPEEADSFLEGEDAEECQRRYDIVGGVFRHLRSAQDVKDAEAKQLARIDDVKVYVPGADMKQTTAQPNVLVQPIPSGDRQSITCFDFVSSKVRRLWIQNRDNQAVVDVVARLQQAHNQETRDVYGRIFEEFVILQLKATPVFSRRTLGKDGPLGVLEPWALPQKPNTTEFYGNDCQNLEKQFRPTLYIPKSSNYPVVDALLVHGTTVDLVQVTVNETHKPKFATAKKLIDDLEGRDLKVRCITWITDVDCKLRKKQSLDEVPAGADEKFWTKLPQYVCRVGSAVYFVKRKGSGKGTAIPLNKQGPSDADVLKLIKEQIDSTANGIVSGEGTEKAPR
eukprot:6458848-Amphidinium_carterae.1